MPLVKIDLQKGKSEEELQKILDIIHETVVTAFKVPDRDRYQIVTQHNAGEMILLDTGLGFNREHGQEIAITVFSRKRDTQSKEVFYHTLANSLQQKTGIDSKNILISIFENDDADWSFGYGKAQFLTGDLS